VNDHATNLVLARTSAFHPKQAPQQGWLARRRSRRLDEIHCLARLLTMSEDAARFRSQAKRCRRLAENVSTDQDQAMFRRVAKDFDEAADELEKKA